MFSDVVLAHAGHWAVDLLFLAPVLVVLGWVVIANYRGRGRERSGEGRSETKGRDRASER
jgi:hypothetical protein